MGALDVADGMLERIALYATALLLVGFVLFAVVWTERDALMQPARTRCSDFRTQAEAQAYLANHPALDRDSDSRACEGLP